MKILTFFIILNLLFAPLTPALAQRKPPSCEGLSLPPFFLIIHSKQAQALLNILNQKKETRARIQGLPTGFVLQQGQVCVTDIANAVLANSSCYPANALGNGFSITSGNIAALLYPLAVQGLAQGAPGAMLPFGVVKIFMAPESVLAAPNELVAILEGRLSELSQIPPTKRNLSQELEFKISTALKDLADNFTKPGKAFDPAASYREIRLAVADIFIQELLEQMKPLLSRSLPFDWKTKKYILPWNKDKLQGEMELAVANGKDQREASDLAIKEMTDFIDKVSKTAVKEHPEVRVGESLLDTIQSMSSHGVFEEWGVYIDAEKADYLRKVIKGFLGWPYELEKGVVQVFQDAAVWFDSRQSVQKELTSVNPKLWQLVNILDQVFVQHLNPILGKKGLLDQLKDKVDTTLATVDTLVTTLRQELKKARVNEASAESEKQVVAAPSDPLGWRNVLLDDFMAFALGDQSVRKEILTIIKMQIIKELEPALIEAALDILNNPSLGERNPALERERLMVLMKRFSQGDRLDQEKSLRELLDLGKEAARIKGLDIADRQMFPLILEKQISIFFIASLLHHLVQEDYINNESASFTKVFKKTVNDLIADLNSENSIFMQLQGEGLWASFIRNNVVSTFKKQLTIIQGNDGKKVWGTLLRLEMWLVKSLDLFMDGINILVGQEESAAWQKIIKPLQDHGEAMVKSKTQLTALANEVMK